MPKQPIIRHVSTDKYDANNRLAYNPMDDVTLYYVFLYRDKKPVYKLSCIYKNVLNDCIDTFLKDDPSLEFIVPIMTCKIKNKQSIQAGKDVVVEDV